MLGSINDVFLLFVTNNFFTITLVFQVFTQIVLSLFIILEPIYLISVWCIKEVKYLKYTKLYFYNIKLISPFNYIFPSIRSKKNAQFLEQGGKMFLIFK